MTADNEAKRHSLGSAECAWADRRAAGAPVTTAVVHTRHARVSASERLVGRTIGWNESRRSATRSTSPPSSRLAKPLFRNTLLQEVGPHEVPPLLTVVLDLDETLVSNRSTYPKHGTMRPYCLHVLNALRHFTNVEVVLWTASTKDTAVPVLRQLNAVDEVFDDVIFRNDVWFTETMHTKDLRLLGRDIDHVVIVENSANSCKLNPRHAILVEEFRANGNTNDAALVNVYYMIEALVKYRKEGLTVPEGLQQLVKEGHLCHTIELEMPASVKSLIRMGVSPRKLPAFGTFTRSNTTPPLESIMPHWTK